MDVAKAMELMVNLRMDHDTNQRINDKVKEADTGDEDVQIP